MKEKLCFWVRNEKKYLWLIYLNSKKSPPIKILISKISNFFNENVKVACGILLFSLPS
jgi:hypothetical protein